jgi:hypothetical protein
MNKLKLPYYLILVAVTIIPFKAKAEEKISPPVPGNVCVGHIVPIDSVPGRGVLYKPENIHGGRGPSFLVQNVSQRTNKQTLVIRNARCEPIATIGLFKTDFPFGSRYYMASGGSGQSDAELLRLARLVGSNNILFEGVNGTWIRVKNPLLRDGSVIK